ncbi:MAG: GNAT family N-acetyltransferase [Sphingomonadales bacterium]|nr:GNAT family N-acetyltransferase [Sphingomonadales bacterium]
MRWVRWPTCNGWRRRRVEGGQGLAALRIIEDDLSGAAIRALLEEHFAGMLAASPPGTCHFLDIDGLKAPGVTFWSAWVDGADGTDGGAAPTLAGMGALKQHDAALGEVKSMRTHAAHLRTGVAAAVLTHIIAEARARGLVRLALETGTSADFAPAIALYHAHGFVDCAPFADYSATDFNRYLVLEL